MNIQFIELVAFQSRCFQETLECVLMIETTSLIEISGTVLRNKLFVVLSETRHWHSIPIEVST